MVKHWKFPEKRRVGSTKSLAKMLPHYPVRNRRENRAKKNAYAVRFFLGPKQDSLRGRPRARLAPIGKVSGGGKSVALREREGRQLDMLRATTKDLTATEGLLQQVNHLRAILTWVDALVAEWGPVSTGEDIPKRL